MTSLNANADKQPTSKTVAIYTRKSTDEGLEQEFNTLDAQRLSGEKFVESQAGQGWVLSDLLYDDGGFSGATMDRPGFQKLLADIKAGRVNVVVVYRIDRLSRSLLDFAKILAFFEEHGVAFVSVTESFSTANSTGKLLLNILMSFAEFERLTIAERTRDKMAATRRRGQWTGGRAVLGYNVENKRLVVNGAEAALVRDIYQAYLRFGSITAVVQDLNDRGHLTKKHASAGGRESGGKPFTVACVRKILTNPTYLGVVQFEGERYDGQHDAIVDQDLWDRVQATIQKRRCRPRESRVSPLAGLLRCANCGCAFTPTYTRKQDKVYRYYECAERKKRGAAACPKGRLPAPRVEEAVMQQVRAIGRNDALLQATVAAGGGDVDVVDLKAALTDFDPLWEVLTMEEQAEVFRILIERIDYDAESGEIRLNLSPDGARLLAGEAA